MGWLIVPATLATHASPIYSFVWQSKENHIYAQYRHTGELIAAGHCHSLVVQPAWLYLRDHQC